MAKIWEKLQKWLFFGNIRKFSKNHSYHMDDPNRSKLFLQIPFWQHIWAGYMKTVKYEYWHSAALKTDRNNCFAHFWADFCIISMEELFWFSRNLAWSWGCAPLTSSRNFRITYTILGMFRWLQRWKVPLLRYLAPILGYLMECNCNKIYKVA